MNHDQGDGGGSDRAGEGDFDVVLVHGRTEDGQGAQVLRARPGRLEAGEVRALESGRALVPGGQVVQLSSRGAPNLYDVKVEYEVPDPRLASAEGQPQPGPPSAEPPQTRPSSAERPQTRASSAERQAKLAAPARPSGGPAQVATREYRDSWERTFGSRRGRSMAN